MTEWPSLFRVCLLLRLECGYTDDMKYYYFAIDSLTDFLIARSLFEDISGKDYHDKVVIIKSKMDAFYSIHEALIIAIFDNMMPDYEQIINF